MAASRWLSALAFFAPAFVLLGYAFARHPRAMFVVRHPLTASGEDAISSTGVAAYQAGGALLAVVGVGSALAVAWPSTGVTPLALAAVGGVVCVAAGLAMRRAGPVVDLLDATPTVDAPARAADHLGVALGVVGVGALAGAAVAFALG